MDIIGIGLFIMSTFLGYFSFVNYQESAKEDKFYDLIVTIYLLLVAFYSGAHVFIL